MPGPSPQLSPLRPPGLLLQQSSGLIPNKLLLWVNYPQAEKSIEKKKLGINYVWT